jgi:hypothetical protein
MVLVQRKNSAMLIRNGLASGKYNFDIASTIQPDATTSYILVMMNCMKSTQSRIDTLNAERRYSKQRQGLES